MKDGALATKSFERGDFAFPGRSRSSSTSDGYFLTGGRGKGGVRFDSRICTARREDPDGNGEGSDPEKEPGGWGE